MIDRSIMRIDAMLAFLGGRSEGAPAGARSDPGLRVGQTRSSVAMTKPAHEELCSSAPLSQLALQAEP